MVTKKHGQRLNNDADNQFLYLGKEAFPWISEKKNWQNWNKNDFSFILTKYSALWALLFYA